MPLQNAEHQSVTYLFTRDQSSVAGFLSPHRPSTDAMHALAQWGEVGPGRTYETLVDKDDEVVVRLTFMMANRDQAASDLNAVCSKWGVTRELADATNPHAAT